VQESALDNLSFLSDAKNNTLKLQLRLSEEVKIKSLDNKEYLLLKCGDSLE
jgi:hypothetical protein